MTTPYTQNLMFLSLGDQKNIFVVLKLEYGLGVIPYNIVDIINSNIGKDITF